VKDEGLFFQSFRIFFWQNEYLKLIWGRFLPSIDSRQYDVTVNQKKAELELSKLKNDQNLHFDGKNILAELPTYKIFVLFNQLHIQNQF
jgi:hypothetical protein